MQELIKVDIDTQTVSARELHKQLNKCMSFKEFFIKVSECRVLFDFEELRVLREVVKKYSVKYGSEAIVYLADSISCERTLPCKSLEARKNEESEMKRQIVNNFNTLFPNFKFVSCEKEVPGVGRIDIYAMCDDRAVIIEIKTENKNPNAQLLAYSYKFDNPILIGITQRRIGKERQLEGAHYFTFDELKGMVKEWVI